MAIIFLEIRADIRRTGREGLPARGERVNFALATHIGGPAANRDDPENLSNDRPDSDRGEAFLRFPVSVERMLSTTR